MEPEGEYIAPVTMFAGVERLLGSSPFRRRAVGIALCMVALALTTGAIYVCKTFVPVLSLSVLYLLAVLPVAVLLGRAYAIGVAVASAALFNFLFPPAALHAAALERRALVRPPRLSRRRRRRKRPRGEIARANG